uniref:TRPM-like domain-containing protein n=1 Tax=Caenorhabditis japonica TaxID=281687 RepID=A0A8R1IB62_CAEJA
MMEALIHDRVDFVRLLLEQGINMQKFLTISRLDELYNTDKGPPNTLFYIVKDVVRVRPGYRFKLPDIGLVIEKLMGNSYKCFYTSSEFRERYKQRMKRFKNAQKKALGVFLNRPSRGGSGIASRQSTEGGIGGVGGGGSVPGVFGSSFGNQDTLCEPMNRSALSGSRALSNHILWRSAFRSNNFDFERWPWKKGLPKLFRKNIQTKV